MGEAIITRRGGGGATKISDAPVSWVSTSQINLDIDRNALELNKVYLLRGIIKNTGSNSGNVEVHIDLYIFAELVQLGAGIIYFYAQGHGSLGVKLVSTGAAISCSTYITGSTLEPTEKSPFSIKLSGTGSVIFSQSATYEPFEIYEVE